MNGLLNFLKDLNLTDDAIKIYNDCLGKSPLTYGEIYSLVINLSPEDFKVLMDVLIDQGLFIQIIPQKTGLIMHYIAVPPFQSLLNLFSSFDSNITNMSESIKEILVSSLDQIFKENQEIEMDSVYDQFQGIFKDFSESSMIEKHDVEELMEDLGEFKETKEAFSDLKEMLSVCPQRIMNAINIQQSNFTEDLIKIKDKKIEIIKTFELKKKEKDVIDLIETFFTEIQQKMTKSFISEVDVLIKKKYIEIEENIEEVAIKPIETHLDDTLQIGNDFKLLYLNVISNFESKLKEFQKKLVKKKEKLDSNIQKTVSSISNKIIEIVQKSINQLLDFSKPIEILIKEFDIKKVYSEKITVDNIWLVNSKSKVLEEITNIIMNSTNQITIIVPKIERFLNIIEFQNLPKTLQIRIASNDPHVNSVVKKFKELQNLEFRTIKNNDIIGLKGDDNHIIIGIIKEDSEDPLDEIAGIGSNYKPIINIFNQIIEAIWVTSQTDIGKPDIKITPKTISPVTVPTPPTIPEKPITDIKPEPQSVVADITEGSFVSKVFPKAGDDVGMELHNAFNLLIQRVNTITGIAFSIELEKIAEIILEKRGFSVTLHKIRALINKYKDHVSPFISQSEKDEIFEEIEEFKKRLL